MLGLEVGITPTNDPITLATAKILSEGSATGCMIEPAQGDTVYQNLNGILEPADEDDDPVGLIFDIYTWEGRGFEGIRGIQTEKITNGDFAESGNTDDWVAGFGATLSVDGDQMVITNNTSFGKATIQVTGLSEGDIVVWAFDLERGIGTPDCIVNCTDTFPTVYVSETVTTDGTHTFVSRCDSNTTGTVELILIGSTTNAGDTTRISNVTAKVIPGNALIQETDANRPLFKTSGGVNWLEGNGTDQWMRATFTINQSWERVSSIRQLSWTSGDTCFGGVTTSGGTYYQAGSDPQMYVFSGTFGLSPTGELANTDQVVYERHDGASSKASIDGGTVTTANAGTNAAGGVTLFASNAAAAHGNFRCHGFIMREEMTAAQLATAIDWASALH